MTRLSADEINAQMARLDRDSERHIGAVVAGPVSVAAVTPAPWDPAWVSAWMREGLD